jgi:Holliday junction resolvase-like predicted endonuclease
MERIRFTLNGQRYELSRTMVESRLSSVEPEAIRKHAVRVNGTWYPAVQAFEVALGVPRAEFISHTARRHLVALGFEVHGEIDSRNTVPAAAPKSETDLGPGASSTVDSGKEWHAEANVQAAVVTALAGAGWRILSVANTATKERGVDIVAERDAATVGVEVKGYPSRAYADPSRAGETKRTAPSTQAGHWFAQAVLAAMRLRGKEPAWRSVIALPDYPRYRDLHSETDGSLAAAQIEVWWVEADGKVSLP